MSSGGILILKPAYLPDTSLVFMHDYVCYIIIKNLEIDFPQ